MKEMLEFGSLRVRDAGVTTAAGRALSDQRAISYLGSTGLSEYFCHK